MLASEIIAPARVLAKDPNPNPTYSDPALCVLLDLLCIDVMDRVKFPYSKLTTATVAGQQEYQLPETPLDDGCGSVYLNGQLLTKTSVPTLQGNEIGIYDQTGFGTQAAGSGGPANNQGSYVPQWTIQPPESYPVPNMQGVRSFAAPWSITGMAPRYYLRGGFIGIVPAPNASAPLDGEGNPINNLQVDIAMSSAYAGPYVWNGSATPQRSITAPTQRIWFPNNFKPCLVWGLISSIGESDGTQMTKESRSNAAAEFREQITELRFWAESYKTDNRIKMKTNRGRVVGRWCRTGGYGGGYP